MKRIVAYEILNHGVDNSQYFQGCGTALTEFTDVATGIGYSEQEALDDALEQLSQGDWDTASNTDLLVDVQSADPDDVVTPILQEYCECEDPDYCECESDLWVFVSVRVRGGEA